MCCGMPFPRARAQEPCLGVSGTSTLLSLLCHLLYSCRPSLAQLACVLERAHWATIMLTQLLVSFHADADWMMRLRRDSLGRHSWWRASCLDSTSRGAPWTSLCTYCWCCWSLQQPWCAMLRQGKFPGPLPHATQLSSARYTSSETCKPGHASRLVFTLSRAHTDFRAVRPSEYSPQRSGVCVLQELTWGMAADSAGHGGHAAGHLVHTDCSDPKYWCVPVVSEAVNLVPPQKRALLCAALRISRSWSFIPLSQV